MQGTTKARAFKASGRRSGFEQPCRWRAWEHTVSRSFSRLPGFSPTSDRSDRPLATL